MGERVDYGELLYIYIRHFWKKKNKITSEKNSQNLYFSPKFVKLAILFSNHPIREEWRRKRRVHVHPN